MWCVFLALASCRACCCCLCDSSNGRQQPGNDYNDPTTTTMTMTTAMTDDIDGCGDVVMRMRDAVTRMWDAVTRMRDADAGCTAKTTFTTTTITTTTLTSTTPTLTPTTPTPSSCPADCPRAIARGCSLRMNTGSAWTREYSRVSEMTRTHAIVENGVKLGLNIVDTSGYGDQMHNENCWDHINYLHPMLYLLSITSSNMRAQDYITGSNMISATIGL
ncbi:hypothetical protein BDZ89DRAFT_1154875 [Hymenopellis radicata]|nr:hypothetical protein BDZ89DRAFT_1154875 [Hymenopellis radicata]